MKELASRQEDIFDLDHQLLRAIAEQQRRTEVCFFFVFVVVSSSESELVVEGGLVWGGKQIHDNCLVMV